MLAAGAALFAFLATVPALGAIASLYGLIADPADIAGHLDGLDAVLPHAVVQFLIDQMSRHAARSSDELGITLGVTVVLALYSARSAAGVSCRIGSATTSVSWPRYPGTTSWNFLAMDLKISQSDFDS